MQENELTQVNKQEKNVVLDLQEIQDNFKSKYPQYDNLLRNIQESISESISIKSNSILVSNEFVQLSERLNKDEFVRIADNLLDLQDFYKQKIQYFTQHQKYIADLQLSFEHKSTIQSVQSLFHVYFHERFKDIHKITFFVSTDQAQDMMQNVFDDMEHFKQVFDNAIDTLVNIDGAECAQDKQCIEKRNEVINTLMMSFGPMVFDKSVDMAHDIYEEYITRAHVLNADESHIQKNVQKNIFAQSHINSANHFFDDVQRVKNDDKKYAELIQKNMFIFKGDLASVKIMDETSPEDVDNITYDENVVETVHNDEHLQKVLLYYLSTKINDKNIEHFLQEGEKEILEATQNKIVKFDIIHNAQYRYWEYLMSIDDVQKHFQQSSIDPRSFLDMLDTYFDNFYDYPQLRERALTSFVDKLLHSDNTTVYRYIQDDGLRDKTLSFFRIDDIDEKRKYLGSFNVATFNIVDDMKGLNLGVTLLDKVLDKYDDDAILEAHSIPQEGINSIYINRYHFVADGLVKNYENTGVDLFHITREQKNKDYHFQNELDNEQLKREIVESTEQIDENTKHFIIKLTKDSIIQQSKQFFEQGFVMTKYDMDTDTGDIYCGFEKK